MHTTTRVVWVSVRESESAAAAMSETSRLSGSGGHALYGDEKKGRNIFFVVLWWAGIAFAGAAILGVIIKGFMDSRYQLIINGIVMSMMMLANFFVFIFYRKESNLSPSFKWIIFWVCLTTYVASSNSFMFLTETVNVTCPPIPPCPPHNNTLPIM